MWCLTGAGLGHARQLTGSLAGGDTAGIIIVSSLILPLWIHLEHWDGHSAEPAVGHPDTQVSQQELEVTHGPLLPHSMSLDSLAQLLVKAAEQCPHQLKPCPYSRV